MCGVITVFVTMAFINVKTYKDNLYLQSRLGTEYQNIVLNLLNLLTFETSKDFWLEQMESPEGKESLARILSEMDYLSVDLHMNNMSEVAVQLDILQSQFYCFKKEGNDFPKESLIELEQNVSILQTVLTGLRSDLGEDSIVWFKEIHDDSSKTHEFIRNELIRSKIEVEN